MSEHSVEYSLPGVLHYLQAEWRKFEREKNEWAIERAEFQARIALLEGERRGLDNIKTAMVKRVKMLEYALKQERKRHDGLNTETTEDLPDRTIETVDTPTKIDNKAKEKSREILKSCLQEINYLTSFQTKLPLTNAFASVSRSQQPQLSNRRNVVAAVAPLPPSNTNSPVLAPAAARPQARKQQQQQQKSTPNNERKTSYVNMSSPIPKKSSLREEEDVEVPVNVDEVAMINNIKKETEHYNNSDKQENNETLSQQIQEKFHLSEDKVEKLLKHANKGQSKQGGGGLLAGDFDPNQIGDINQSLQPQPKIWKPRVTIKGHLDSVRSVCFHPNEMIAASGSDDGTVKIWNLQRATGKDGNAVKKGALEEADPGITYRGHTNIVTAVAISAKQNRVYSASLDSTIRVWDLPEHDRGLFAPVDPSLSITTYIGHTDAIWDFKVSDNNILASASADGTVKIWDTSMKGDGGLLKSLVTFNRLANLENTVKVKPTSIDFSHINRSRMAVGYTNAEVRIYDIETAQVLTVLKGSDDSYDNTISTQINSVVMHPTLPLLVSGHEDKHIKFYDLNTGECIQTVSGHLDAVTCLDIDPSGTTMVSGGHDSSIRIWDFASRTCIQEFSAHRRKGDEGVLSAKFHRSSPWMVSGGADGIVKVYHHSD